MFCILRLRHIMPRRSFNVLKTVSGQISNKSGEIESSTRSFSLSSSIKDYRYRCSFSAGPLTCRPSVLVQQVRLKKRGRSKQAYTPPKKNQKGSQVSIFHLQIYLVKITIILLIARRKKSKVLIGDDHDLCEM